MAQKLLREYGVAQTIDFTLFEVDGIDFRVDAVHVSGDTKIMKDEGVEINTTNSFADEGTGYSIVLTATEMQAARIVIYTVDQTATKVWLDEYLIIETYGNASAQHAVNLNDSVRAGLTAIPNAAADAPGGLPISDAGALDMDAILIDTNETQTKLPTNNIMGSSVKTDKDDEIDAILVDTNEMQGKLPTNNIMGSSVKTDKDDEIDAILVDTNEMQLKLPSKAFLTGTANSDGDIEMNDSTGDFNATQQTRLITQGDAVLDAVNTELASPPAITASLRSMIKWFFTIGRNRITETATLQTIRNDADDADIATRVMSDNGTTFDSGKAV